MRKQEIVIVGAGPAGCAAAIQCRRLGVTPLILERTGRVGGLIKNAYEVKNYPAIESITGPDLANRLARQLEQLDLPVTTAELTRINPAAGPDQPIEIEISDLTGSASTIATDRLILATGTTPLHLPVPGATESLGSGLYYEVFDLLGSPRWRQLPTGKHRVAVIGGGEAAHNYALSLARSGAAVSLLIRTQTPRARGKLLELVASNRAIEVESSTVSIEIQPGADSLILATERSGKRLERKFDAVLGAIGRHSRISDLLTDYQPEALRSIATTRTGLFVIGDARAGALGQMAIAAGDGLAAAAAAIGGLDAGDR